MNEVATERRGSHDDRGIALAESIVAVMLTGVLLLALLTATITAVKASSTTRTASEIETAIVNAADRVNRAPKRCDYLVYVQAAVQTQGWAADRAVVVQEYFVPGADPTASGSWLVGALSSPACATGVPTDLLVQRVTITLTSPDGQLSRSIQVVKSDV